jgi:uncharacterized surface protein with fasciclin (FAS1) repeats
LLLSPLPIWVQRSRGAGPFAVFTPSDDVFSKLPAGTDEDLVRPENEAKLAAILTLHVGAGKVLAADITGAMSPASVNGEHLHIATDHGVTVNGAHVTTAGIECTNGVIHVIDAVLLPSA